MPAPTLHHNQPEYSVSDLSGALKRVVEDTFGYVRVRGELSGFKRAASGHLYMDLKDDKAVLNAVCWRGVASKIGFQPEDGLEVICTGRLSTYPGRSNYQLIIESMEPAGEGALMALLEKRKKQLAAEGLFAPERKQRLPFMPQTIGVITSPTGAVIRDILHRLADRFPVHVLVWPVRVQGEGAMQEITAAIEGFARLPDAIPRPDLLIIARGGGSIEDLWCFNEEPVIRAAAACPIPIISAVGHETDTTLIDYVADQRAPTPTAAAEIAVPVRREWMLTLQDWQQRLSRAALHRLSRHQDHVGHVSRAIPSPQQMLQFATQRLDDGCERLARALPHHIQQHEQRLHHAASRLAPQRLMQQYMAQHQQVQQWQERLQRAINQRVHTAQHALKMPGSMLESLSYHNVLKRGYAVVMDAQLRSISQVKEAGAQAQLIVRFQDGDLPVAPSSRTASRTPTKPAKRASQHSLFDD